VITPKESPDTLALRAPPRPVKRLNRRSLAIVVVVLSATVMGGTLWSLQSQRRTDRNAPVELHNTDRIAHADGLAQLPDDYSKIAPPVTVSSTPPVLGPPLPGDLGGAMLRAEPPGTDSSLSGAPTLRADPAADAARAERISRQREAEEAARASLFFRSATQRESAASASSGSGKSTSVSESSLAQAAAGSPSIPDKSSDRSQGAQQQNKTFIDRPSDMGTLSTHELQPPISPYQVMAGTVIPAALITGINSDLPGQVLASVTENVYDTATGQHLLIPQGSRLIGQYDSQVAFGQRRVLLVWTRLTLPDASSIALDRLPGVDASGYAGLQDGVDWHWQQLLAGAALSTLIGVGAELAAPDRSNGQSQVIVATRQSVQDSVNQVGQELTRRSLNVQPTLTIRPGFPVRVIVNKDLVLRPYQPLFFERSKP
jgi:type IV secretion system protein VirB10